jgi:C4-type Zn-finger protein
MKTSELKKWLEEKKWEYKETEGVIVIIDVVKVYKYKMGFTIEEHCHFVSSLSLGLLEKVIEYAKTPISEREDEKKYRIQACEDVAKAYRYLTLTLPDKNFFFSSAIYREKEYQTRFTQQEIDNFSLEIKGAIECGFLRKVEVNE